MAGTVTLPGLVSNTDWSKLITDMINAQKAATINPLTTSKTSYQAKLAAWQSLNGKLSTIYNYIDDNDLENDDGYKLFSSSLYSSNSAITPSNVLNPTLGSVNGPGTYSVEVTQLARAEKVSSDTLASNSTALGLSGDIVINGHKVNIAGTDTLSNVAGKINSSNTGVTASVLAVSSSDYRLTLQSVATGAAGISLKNGGSAGLLESLGIHTGVEQLAHASDSDALSDTYSSATGVIGTLLGLTAPQSGLVTIKDKSYTFNLGTDTLTTIAAAINADPPTGVAASVESVTLSGQTIRRLKLTNIVAGDLTDANNVLETLGVLGGIRKNSLQTGLDASLKIDNAYTVSSASNTISGVIDGVTLNLTATNSGNPIEVRVSQDNSQISQKTSTLVDDMNGALNYIKEQNTYSSDSVKPLFGEINLALIRNNISTAVYSEVSGNTTYKTASDIGITYQKDGTLAVNTSTLSTALSANSTEVLNVLKNMNDKLYDSMHLYIDPTTGTLTYMAKSIENNITSIDKKIKELNDRYDKQQELMEKKYNALELLISQSTMTKNWLTQQVNYMTKSNQ